MAHYNLYSFDAEELNTARQVLEEVLGVKFSTHDSLYFGIYYIARGSKGDTISIKRNFDSQEEEYLGPDFQDCSVLIYIDKASAEVVEEYQKKLLKTNAIALLRQEVL